MKMMRNGAMVLIAGALIVVSMRPGSAQSNSVLDAFGGKPGLDKVADLGIEYVLKDPRIKDRFAAANIPRLKALLSEQFCALLDGPCQYTGRDMHTAHEGMAIQDKDFNALAEDFQKGMDDLGIPFRDQNVLVAKLASLEKQVVQAP